MLESNNPYFLRTVTASSYEQLSQHKHAWNHLAWSSPQKLPTFFPNWVDAFLRNRRTTKENWLCIFAYLGDKLVGVLPIIVSPHPILGQRHSRLRTPSDDFMTHSGDIALDPEHAQTALQGLLSQLRREIPSHLDLEIRAVRKNSPVWQVIHTGLDDYLIQTGSDIPYSVIDVRGEFTNYATGLGNLRRNLIRYRKRLEGRGVVSVELRRGLAADELPARFFSPRGFGMEGTQWNCHPERQKSIVFLYSLG